MMKSFRRLFLILMFASLVFSGCSPNNETNQTPALESTTVPLQPTKAAVTGPDIDEVLQGEEIIYPIVLESTPGFGEELALDGKISLRFDQAMKKKSVEEAWQLKNRAGDSIKGNFTWQAENKIIVFTPLEAFQPGEQYQLNLGETALSAEGNALETGYEQQFYTVNPLQVAQVFPEPGSKEVESSTQITAIFNQPVVPLGIAEEQINLIQPLEFDPPVSGRGEWVNTSVYVFQPDQPLYGATTYTVNVKKDLQSTADPDAMGMLEAYNWQFDTLVPGIASIVIDGVWTSPPTNQIDQSVSILLQMQVNFFQPMVKDSMWSAIHLISSEGKEIPMRFKWNPDATELTLTPRAYLHLGGAEYRLVIDADAQAQNGGTIQTEHRVQFYTIDAPSIRAMYQTSYSSVIVDFQTQMDRNSFDGRIRITPPLPDMHWYYNSGDHQLTINGFLPSSSYTVTILPGTTDIFGNAINDTVSDTFTFGALAPYFYLNLPSEPQYRLDGPQEAFFEYINIQSVDVDLYKVSIDEYLAGSAVSQFSIPKDDPIWRHHIATESPLNIKVVKKLDFTEGGKHPLEPGYYLLGMDSPQIKFDGKGKYVTLVPFIVTPDSLNMKISEGNGLVWQTNLTSGEPVPGMEIVVWAAKLGQVATGITNQDGVFEFDLPGSYEQEVLYAYSPTKDHQAFTSQRYYSGVSPDDFGLWSEYYYSQRYDTLTSYIYTDRPIYRPGQIVYFKGVVRNDKDLVYSLPGNKLDSVSIIVENYEKEIFKTELPLTEFGSFAGEFELDSGTTLGSYTISARDAQNKVIMGSVDINVAEYRKPEFVVAVQATPVEVALGDKIQAIVQSSYYSGGGLVDADVAYTVRSSPYSFYPGGVFRGYNFSDVVNSYYGGDGSDEFYRIISEGNGVTDAEGIFTVEIPADARSTAGSRLLTFDATVTDITGNVVSGQSQITAHGSSIYAGVKSGSYVGKVGQEQSFDLAVVDWAGKPVEAQALSAAIYKLEWFSVKKEDASGVLHWEYSTRETPVERFSSLLTNEEGLASISFTPEKGGTYFARVNALDERGRKSQSSAMMWVSGYDFIPWKQNDDRTFDLITDKDSYKPGEEAEILIASPYQGETYALITTERGLIRSQEVIKLTDNSTILKLPITKDMAPTVYLSVLVVKGVDESNPYPDFKMSMAAINVSTKEQELTVNLQADTAQAGPGDEVTYDVQVQDYKGQPVAAEVSLGLTDLSVLALMDANAPPMLDYFYAKRGLAVQTSVPITHNVESYNKELKESVTEGLSAGSGGGKGGGDYGVDLVRQDFLDTPFWLADAVTDKEGKTSVTVTLPDNLTTWRMDSRAVTMDTQVGQNIVDIISTKPLLVRPQTPRFFVVGDEVTLGTAVHNNSSEDLLVTVKLEASGVEIVGEAEQHVEIPAKQQVYVTWVVTVPEDAERADFVFRAESDNYQDASRPTLGTLDNQGIPIYRYEVHETVSTSGALTEGGLRTETIQLPKDMAVENGQLDITIEPSLVAGMQAGLNYLEHYEYECNEQTISRFLPNILTYKAMKTAGMQDAELEENLKTQVNLAMQRLDNAQLSDGGWGWWPGNSQSNPTTSAYVMYGLWQAKQAGYDIDQEVLDNGQKYLLYQINLYAKKDDLKSSYSINTLTFMVYVMALMDQPVVSQAIQLADDWQYLSLESQAYLAYALHYINAEDTRITTLHNSIIDEVILSASGAHWEENSRDYWNWNTDTRSTAVILDTMIQIDPQNPLTANAVRWLMRNRTNGHWASTQETAWTLISLTHWMEVSGDLQADYAYGLKFNGDELETGQVTRETLEEIRTLKVDVADFMKDELNRLTIARTDGGGNMYYTADLNVYLPVNQVKALDQGVIISRNYFHADDMETPVQQAQQGDLLVAQLTIVLPQSVHYLLVEDMLPAGMEAVDTALNTSEAYYGDIGLSRNRGWGWWYFTHTELRDEKVALSAEYLNAGTYTFNYLVRASFPGTYNVIPPVAQEFYFPDVYGRGDGSQFVILP